MFYYFFFFQTATNEEYVYAHAKVDKKAFNHGTFNRSRTIGMQCPKPFKASELREQRMRKKVRSSVRPLFLFSVGTSLLRASLPLLPWWFSFPSFHSLSQLSRSLPSVYIYGDGALQCITVDHVTFPQKFEWVACDDLWRSWAKRRGQAIIRWLLILESQRRSSRMYVRVHSYNI